MYIKIYAYFLKLHLSRWNQFKMNLLMEVVASLFEVLLNVLTLHIIFSKVIDVKGWSLGEMLLLYSMWLLGYAFYEMFAENVQNLPLYIRTGELDTLIMKPIPLLFHVFSLKLNFHSISKLLYGLILLSISIETGHFSWGFWKWALFILLVISCNLVNFGIYASVSSICFWAGHLPVISGIVWILWLPTQYPLDIYTRSVRWLFYIIPLAFTSYFPTLWLLDKSSGVWGLLTPIVSVIWVFIANFLWNKGVNHYKSAGS